MRSDIYIGWDSRETIAYDVCEYSIQKHSSSAVNIQPLKQAELRNRNIYARPPDIHASTEFSLTRFLVPTLNNYTGWALFCDCDFLWLGDVTKLFELADPSYACQVVKHNYAPSESVKMDGQPQQMYPRKNWSSLVLWNCGHPANFQLTATFVNYATPQMLHRFQWLDDSLIGELDYSWNWLVGWYTETAVKKPQAIHYTQGGPYFKQYFHTQYHEVWKQYYAELKGTEFTIQDVLDP